MNCGHVAFRFGLFTQFLHCLILLFQDLQKKGGHFPIEYIKANQLANSSFLQTKTLKTQGTKIAPVYMCHTLYDHESGKLETMLLMDRSRVDDLPIVSDY